MPVSDSEKDNNCEFLQTPDGTNYSYIIDMFSIQFLYKGNFEIIFYTDNQYTNNEEDYLRLSVWSFRGKIKSKLNNYLCDMTTNYKTSFLLPHDYEITTFNYPQYVLPPVPYNYQPYTKDIMTSNAVLPLKTKIGALEQCKKGIRESGISVNLFSDDEFNYGYYEIEIDLKQIYLIIQSISKFQDDYKKIEISNINNIQVECGPQNIDNFIPNRNVNLSEGGNGCTYNLNLLSNIILQENGRSKVDKVNFDNTITLYKDNITNDIKTFATAYTNGLPNYTDYKNSCKIKNNVKMQFLLQITKLSNNDRNEIKKTELQDYYTNDVKLKIIFSKILYAILSATPLKPWIRWYFGNDKYITIDISNPNVLGIRNKSDNPVKITIKSR